MFYIIETSLCLSTDLFKSILNNIDFPFISAINFIAAPKRFKYPFNIL